MIKIKPRGTILENIINYFGDKFKCNFISNYGIGSYFNQKLPSDWRSINIDLIVIEDKL